MKKLHPHARVVATDHAVLRWLEREHGVDISVIRRHLCGKVVTAAQLGAVAVQTGKVRLMLVHNSGYRGEVAITTALPRKSNLPALLVHEGNDD